jgi:hypothetical protein
MKSFSIDPVNGLCGALFMLAGLFFAIQSASMQIGTAFRMGPGYFPLVLSIILIGLGAVVFVSALRHESEPIGHIAWRGMIFILLAPVLFGLLLRGLGFIPSIFVTALVASLASTRMRPFSATAIAATLALFTTLVFVYGLGLPFRLFGPWIGF